MLAQLITETVLGALTGYITNDTAIRSLFKPDGVIEQTRDDFAREAGQLLESQVLTQAVLAHQLMLPEVQDALADALHSFLYEELPRAYDTMTLADLPEYETAAAHLQQILLRFAASERETVLHYLKKHFSTDDILTEAQCTRLADTLQQLLMDTLAQEQLAERIWQSWKKDKGSCTIESLGLAELCHTVARNLAAESAHWLAELEAVYGMQLKEAAQNSVRLLQLEPVLLELDARMEEYTLGQYLNCTAEELNAALQTLLHSATGTRLINDMVSELLAALETVDTPIQALIPSDLLDTISPFLQEKMPVVMTQVVDWVWQNKQSVQRMLEETVDEIAQEAGGMKGMLLEQLKESLLGELMQSSDLYQMLLDLVSGDNTADDTVDLLMHKLTAALSENTVGQLVQMLNKNGNLQTMVRQFIYENLNRFLAQSGNVQLTQLLDWKPGSLHLARHIDKVETLLVQVLLFAAKQIDLPAVVTKGCDTLIAQPLQTLIPIDTAAFTEAVQNLVQKACAYAAKELPQIAPDTLYSTLYDTIVWWLEANGADALNDVCAHVTLKDLIALAADKLDDHTAQMADALSQAGLAMTTGRLSMLAESQIQSLSSAEMLELVEDFMGRELQPLNYLGAGMGAAAGATVGMALSTAIPAVSMANPALAASVLAGKAAVFGAVGYTTNCAAVKGLFWPYEPVAGIRTIQGVIPKQKERFAGSMGRLVDRYVINEEILSQQIAQLQHELETQHTAENLAGNTQLFSRIFAELALKRRDLTEPVCAYITDYGSTKSKDLLQSLGDVPFHFVNGALPLKTNEDLTMLYQKLSVWLTAQMQQDIPLDTLIGADTLWQWAEKTAAGIPLPDFSGMVQELLQSERTLQQLAGEHFSSILDTIQYYLANAAAQQKTQAQLAAAIEHLLDADKLYSWLVHNGTVWVEDNISMLFHWIESMLLELLQSRQDSLTAAVEQALLNRMGLMMQMGYAMMNGGEIVAAIVDRLLNQKIPIFLSVKRKELESLLGAIWAQELAPAVQQLAESCHDGSQALSARAALRTLLAQPAMQQCAVQIGLDSLQLAAMVPVQSWGRYINIHALLAGPQMQLGFQWQTHSREILAAWQQPLQSFCADKLHLLTTAKLCAGYENILPLGQLIESPNVNDTRLALVQQLEANLAVTAVQDWLYWDELCAVLADDIAALLQQEQFGEWMQHEAELMVLAIAAEPDNILPPGCRAAVIDRAMEAVFATADKYGTELLRRMQLSALAEAQLKQMDSAHLEQVVRGFAGHYLVHIQNRGWLGAIFALPGMILYLL